MKKLLFVGAALFACAVSADWHADMKAMSPEYWAIWTPEVTAKLKADIEKYRKADFADSVGAPAGVEVKVEQISHAFFVPVSTPFLPDTTIIAASAALTASSTSPIKSG